MNRRPGAVALVAVLLILRPAGTASGARQDFGTVSARLAAWRQAVDAHTPGETDQAVHDVARWPAARLAATVDLVHELARYTSVDDLVRRGAMLHLDAVVAGVARTIGPVPPRLLQGSFESRDSRGEARSAASVHLASARMMLDAIDPRRDDFARRWYRATTAWLAAADKLADLKPHLEKARAVFEADAATEYDRGCLYEAFASRRVRAIIDTARQPGLNFDVPTERASLSEAARRFRRALELDPAMSDARLRLGRVLLLMGRDEEGTAELRRALQETTRPESRFDAALFLGRAAESRGDLDEARARFMSALALYSSAQSAGFALARVSGDRGQPDDERRRVSVVLDHGPDRRHADDPWWTYHKGVGRDAALLVADLRQRVRNQEP